MPYMDPDLFQRLTLLNQYKILAKIDPDGESDWQAAANMVIRNWPIDMLPSVGDLLSNQREPFTASEREFVLDVLTMHEALQRAEDDRTVTVTDGGARFDGFDGNGETAYMAFVQDLIGREGSFSDIRVTRSSFNSHMAMVEVYNRMLEQWREWGKPLKLTAGQYDALIAARVHPSNR